MPRPKKNTASRLDPAPRPIDGALPYFNVLNKDPSRVYVWVYKAATDYGPEHYSFLGYQLERYSDTGPRPAMASVDLETGLTTKPSGTVIESRGNVLMSVSKERYDEIVEFGSDGVSGQHAATLQEQRMLNQKKHVRDSMRGLNPRALHGVAVEPEKGSYGVVAGEED